ncbi:MAG: DUF401 family protein [Methanobacteriota archaeon]
MIELLKIFLVIALAVFLIYRKVRVEYTIFSSAVFLGLIFGLGLAEILQVSFRAFLDDDTVELALIVVLITFLGVLMKHVESLSNIVDSLNGLFGDARVALMGIPAFIGLLPMPAGAMVSAPFVGELGDKIGISPEQKTVVNYWFRHIWEFSFPLYPAIILAAAILEVPYSEICVNQFPLTVIAVVVGFLLICTRIRGKGYLVVEKSFFENGVVLIKDVWPVALVIILALLFKVNLLASLIVSITFFATSRKVKLVDALKMFNQVNATRLIILVFSAMIFKSMVEASQAAVNLPQIFTELSIPIPVIIFSIPFIVGLLTGYSWATVGISFPIILPFLSSLDAALLAYCGGLMGLFLSPVHLCLVLTREYFKADVRRVYIMLAPLIILMSIAGFTLSIL